MVNENIKPMGQKPLAPAHGVQQSPPSSPKPQSDGANADHETPIGLVAEGAPAAKPGVRAFGAGAGHGLGGVQKSQFKRTVNITGQGATRCRLFHCRISPGPLSFMENQINEWIDGENIEVKHVSQNVGVMEGKSTEPNLIVIVWY